MARTLATGMQTEVAAATAEVVHLVELQLSGGTLRYTTGATSLLWNGLTWTAIGGTLTLGGLGEATGITSAAPTIVFAAVDLTVLSAVLTQNFIGRLVQVWVAHLDPTTRVVVVDPLLIARSYMGGGWHAVERFTADGISTGDVTLTCTDRLSVLTDRRGIQANQASHQSFYASDQFFQFSDQAANTVVDWGKS